MIIFEKDGVPMACRNSWEDNRNVGWTISRNIWLIFKVFLCPKDLALEADCVR